MIGKRPASLAQEHEGRKDIVIFGVTGVTGQIVFEHALSRFNPDQIVVAGRSRTKMEQTIKDSVKLHPGMFNISWI